MQRVKVTPRDNFIRKLESLNFSFYHDYWTEDACYQFSLAEIETIEAATAELYARCIDAVGWVIRQRYYKPFGLAKELIPLIEKSWEEDHPSVYGRFDLCYTGDGAPKLLEFNADTPTSLYEAAVVQWYWLEETRPQQDQFNSIHEKLIETWKWFRSQGYTYIHFTCMEDIPEDEQTVRYLLDTAHQAEMDVSFIGIEEIGWDGSHFVDESNEPIHVLFKLYPTEWLGSDSFAPHLMPSGLQVIEPYWKVLLSAKAILPILWDLFPDHPNLLPTYFEWDRSKLGLQYVQKPIYSREGANVTIHDFLVIEQTEGPYDKSKSVFQAYAPLPDFEGYHPVIGSWIIGGQPAGMGIRESESLITGNFSRFVPHFIEG